MLTATLILAGYPLLLSALLVIDRAFGYPLADAFGKVMS